MPYKYGFNSLGDSLKDYLNNRISVINESRRQSKFIFSLQWINHILLLYVSLLVASLLNPILDAGFITNFLVFIVIFFLYFVLLIIGGLLGKAISSMLLFETNLSLTLGIMLFLIVMALGCHFVNPRVRGINEK